METRTGNQIVDWLMDVSLDERLPAETRMAARRKLRACILRQPGQTVMDVIGPKQ